MYKKKKNAASGNYVKAIEKIWELCFATQETNFNNVEDEKESHQFYVQHSLDGCMERTREHNIALPCNCLMKFSRDMNIWKYYK